MDQQPRIIAEPASSAAVEQYKQELLEQARRSTAAYIPEKASAMPKSDTATDTTAAQLQAQRSEQLQAEVRSILPEGRQPQPRAVQSPQHYDAPPPEQAQTPAGIPYSAAPNSSQGAAQYIRQISPPPAAPVTQHRPVVQTPAEAPPAQIQPAPCPILRTQEPAAETLPAALPPAQNEKAGSDFACPYSLESMARTQQVVLECRVRQPEPAPSSRIQHPEPAEPPAPCEQPVYNKNKQPAQQSKPPAQRRPNAQQRRPRPQSPQRRPVQNGRQQPSRPAQPQTAAPQPGRIPAAQTAPQYEALYARPAVEQPYDTYAAELPPVQPPAVPEAFIPTTQEIADTAAAYEGSQAAMVSQPLSDVAYLAEAVPNTPPQSGYIELPSHQYSSLEDFLEHNPAYGLLELQVLTADAGVPVYGAHVDILKNINGTTYLFHHVATDENGKTEKLALPAPEKDLSFAPPQGSSPYALYTASVSHGDYAPIIFENVMVFPDTESMQVARLGMAAVPRVNESRYAR